MKKLAVIQIGAKSAAASGSWLDCLDHSEKLLKLLHGCLAVAYNLGQ